MYRLRRSRLRRFVDPELDIEFVSHPQKLVGYDVESFRARSLRSEAIVVRNNSWSSKEPQDTQIAHKQKGHNKLHNIPCLITCLVSSRALTLNQSAPQHHVPIEPVTRKRKTRIRIATCVRIEKDRYRIYKKLSS